MNSEIYISRLPLPSRELSYTEQSEKEFSQKHDIADNDEDTARNMIAALAERLLGWTQEKETLNLNFLDYIRQGSRKNNGGTVLGQMSIPASGVSDTLLSETTKDRDNLKVGRVETKESNDQITIYMTARYKPKNKESYETDQYGYTETDLIPAMEFHDLSEMQAALVKEFVPLAVNEAGGFANFRETATKTKSLIDRLEALTLPKLEDVEDGLKKYLEVKERAEELDQKIAETDELIDEIVYDLYGLSEEEIEVVEDAVER